MDTTLAPLDAETLNTLESFMYNSDGKVDEDYLAEWMHHVLRDKIREMGELPSSGQEGLVQIPPSYFAEMPCMDYSSPEKAVPREFFQNSIDAGARNINVYGQSNGVTVEDDGSGMNRDTLVNRLLSLGGSLKNDNSAGGFGKAKEVLYFCWPSYCIHTNGHLVIGAQNKYHIFDLPEKLHRKGTASHITLWNDPEIVKQFFSRTSPPYAFTSCDYFLTHFQTAASLCKTKAVISIDGARVEMEPWGRKIGENLNLGMTIYKNAKSVEFNNVVMVSVRGLNMFASGLSAEGAFFVNFSHDSKDVLTSNRDGLKGEYKEALDAWMQDIASDTRTMAREKVEETLTWFHDDGQGDDATFSVHPEGLDDMAALMDEEGDRHYLPEARSDLSVDTRNSDDAVKVKTSRESCFGFKALSVSKGFEKTSRKILGRGVNCKRLRNMLTCAVRECARDLISRCDRPRPMRLGLGLVFDHNVGGTYRCNSDGVHVISVNPSEYPIMAQGEWKKQDIRGMANTLFHIVAHEMTHAIYRRHNEDFSSLFYSITRGVFNRTPDIIEQMMDSALKPVSSKNASQRAEQETPCNPAP